MAEEIEYLKLTGADFEPYIDEVARLRILVFREFPYLYDGDPEDSYERKYLSTYVNSPGSLIILAKSQGKVIGASSCLPLSQETKEIRAPYEKAGYDLDEIFYFGESVIEKSFRGKGIGSQFFKFREEHAYNAQPSTKFTSFCAVIRPEDHPHRPQGYQPLNEFWGRRGYKLQPDMRVEIDWKDIDQPAKTMKELSVWLKEKVTL